MAQLVDSPRRVRLRNCDSLSKRFCQAIFLGQWQWAHNHSGTWPIFLRAIQLSITWYTIFTLFGLYTFKVIVKTDESILARDLYTYFAGLLTLIFASYWALDSIFARKWSYAANLYNETLKSDKYCSPAVDRMETALMIDLVHMKLWAKTSFARFFQSRVELAIERQFAGDVRAQHIRKLHSGEYTEKQLYDMLSTYLEDMSD